MHRTPREQLVDEAIEAERYILRQQLTAALPYWVELDLSMAQLKTLVVIADAGALSIGQAAEALGITLPTASHLVERLVKAGLVERAEDPVDRRRALARVTSAGDELLRGLRSGSREQLRAWLGQLNDDDLLALTRGLRVLERAARQGEQARHAPATVDAALEAR
jgi:DNA-binding MarR family transcriptional regulator